jgi:hypothetical protein
LQIKCRTNSLHFIICLNYVASLRFTLKLLKSLQLNLIRRVLAEGVIDPLPVVGHFDVHSWFVGVAAVLAPGSDAVESERSCKKAISHWLGRSRSGTVVEAS